jgi:hypothetical protein
VVEVKSRIVDVQGLLSGIDRKRRLARRIAAERGWVADSVGLWLAVAEGRTNRRRVSEHVSTFGAVFDGDGRQLRGWLRVPDRSRAFISFLPTAVPTRRRARPTAGPAPN